MAVAAPTHRDRVSLLGLPVDRLDMASALEAIYAYVRAGGVHHVVTLDSSMCVQAQTDEGLWQIVHSADLVTPDSAGILWACRRARQPLPERVSGVEIVEGLCQSSAGRGHSLFFLGAAAGIAEAAAERMRARFPGCRIVGCRDGYFRPDDEPGVVAAIRAAQPDILCVAMGAPRQERWIARNRAKLGVPVMIGVGGTLDVLSGAVRRAPLWMQRMGCEWLWRLFSNPRKLPKVLLLPRFVLLVLRAPRATAPAG
ncbi:MAG TPA: WecB/TagA/CpsF family glycosyltransferase [Chthonomonadales bacterium]|nr:WecB/TagA/CpsF family glycosyltransferase [Chthonomonadales bacterium]